MTLIDGGKKNYYGSIFQKGKNYLEIYVIIMCLFIYQVFPTRLFIHAISQPPPLPWETIFQRMAAKTSPILRVLLHHDHAIPLGEKR